MRSFSSDGFAVGEIAFGVFCLFVTIAGIIFMASLNAHAIPVTDSYGNTYSPTTNQSLGPATDMTSVEETSMVPLIIIAGAVFLCFVVFLMWVASRHLV